MKLNVAASLSAAWLSAGLAYAGNPSNPSNAGAGGAAPTTQKILMQLKNRYASVEVDPRGFIVSLVSRASAKQYSPAGHPSPVLSIQDGGRLLEPTGAVFHTKSREIELKYANGAVAVVKAEAKPTYFRFQLLSLEPRGTVDDVVWGPLHTTISHRMGDILGVVRDKDWAIGMLGLDDNTIAGPPVDGDCYGMGYYIHSQDPEKDPLPPTLKEGQKFNIGGDGVNDVAFYSRPEEYFNQVCGTGVLLEPEFGSTIAYNSRDRRRARVHLFSLLPGFQGSRPRHQVSDPVDADFIGSGVALYACPDDRALETIESAALAESLPHPLLDGKWVHDRTAVKPDIAWYGPHDKLIEYARELGLGAVIDEGQGEYYANPADHWQGPRVGFSDGRKLTYKEFTDQTNRYGIKYGLHTLCLFLQPNACSDVSPAASEHLQTVCRTKLAEDVAGNDKRIVVTEPSFLAEDGTWPMRDGFNFVRIGTEIVRYQGITDKPPYTLLNVERGFATQAEPHRAGEEVAKLQMNCYQGFAPDMQLLLAYADYYATVLHENGMEYVNFDGFESAVYQNHGYYAVRRFVRRLFETYAKLTGGKALRVTGSCIFSGAWEYMGFCNVGGNENMFNPVENRWGIEGKDLRNAWSSSYIPPTFGVQSFRRDWTVYDAENLQAKAVAWNATYALGLDQDSVEKNCEKDAIFKAFRTWEDARADGAFDQSTRDGLKDLGLKFHLERAGAAAYALSPVKELRFAVSGRDQTIALANENPEQPLQFALRLRTAARSVMIALPDGRTLDCSTPMEKDRLVICTGDRIYIADKGWLDAADKALKQQIVLPAGASKLRILIAPVGSEQPQAELKVWIVGTARTIRAKG